MPKRKRSEEDGKEKDGSFEEERIWNLRMSSKKQLEMQAKFVDLYCETGNARQSAIDAGYKDGKYISNQACNLKRQLANQIQKRMLEMFVDHTPKAFSAMKALMEESESDTVRYQAAKDLMDRAGFKATDKVQIEEDEGYKAIRSRACVFSRS